jgi:hypothetical protein
MYSLKRTLLTSIFFGIIAIGSALAPTASAAGEIGGRPALPREDEPRSQSIFIHTIKPTEMINEKVVVTNRSDKERTILVYSVDAIPTNTGSISCKQRVEKLEDAGGWITLAKNELTLAAGASEIVDMTITAPEKADVGEHNACIAIETKDDEGEVSGNLRIRTRSAIRVALTIPGKLNRSVAIDSYRVTQSNFLQRYDVVLANTGNVSADAKVEVQLRTVFGGEIYKNGGTYPVLAGNKLELSYQSESSPFFGGWFFAQANASYNQNASTWGASKPENIKTVYAKNQLVFIWPRPLAMLIIILLLAAVGYGIYRLIRQEQLRLEVIRSWKIYTVKTGDTLESLAAAASIDWKRLAKINRLKAPYTLEPGSKLYVPKKKSSKKKPVKANERE